MFQNNPPIDASEVYTKGNDCFKKMRNYGVETRNIMMHLVVIVFNATLELIFGESPAFAYRDALAQLSNDDLIIYG